MKMVAGNRLAIALLGAALASAGCSEQHAPAATGAMSSPTANSGESTAARNDQDVTVGLDLKDAFSANVSTEIRKNLEKEPGDVPADTAKLPSREATRTTAPAVASTPTVSSRLPRGAGGASDITFDTIKFEMEKTQQFKPEMLTPAIRALDGKRIRIRGYVLPSFQQSGITQFVLVRDNMQCCFGPGAALYDCVVVDMASGKSTEFKVTPVTVDGTFSVNELLDPETGKHLAVFHLTSDAVR